MCYILSDDNSKERTFVTLRKIYRDAIDQLVEKGIYMDRQVVIRAALRLLFRVHKIEPFYSELIGEVKLEKEDVE